jgi:hypothetical protein
MNVFANFAVLCVSARNPSSERNALAKTLSTAKLAKKDQYDGLNRILLPSIRALQILIQKD